MALSALSTLLAVANASESPTRGCSRINSNVGIATVWVGAITTKEVSASRNTMRGSFMAQVASITSSAAAEAKEVFADGDLGRIMCVAAAVAVGAHTYDKKSVNIQKAYQRTY